MQLAADTVFYQSTARELENLAQTTKQVWLCGHHYCSKCKTNRFSKVYLYSFDYLSATFPWAQPHHGVWHFMDCMYLFDIPVNPFVPPKTSVPSN